MSSGQRRRNRMRWWFEQMRQAVDQGEGSDCQAYRFAAGTSLGGGRGEGASARSIRQERKAYEYDYEV